jgi:hypothetical protein
LLVASKMSAGAGNAHTDSSGSTGTQQLTHRSNNVHARSPVTYVAYQGAHRIEFRGTLISSRNRFVHNYGA